MKKIDTDDWSEVVIAVGSKRITQRTLQSEEWYRNFCDDYGYVLISFCKGTNPYCA